MKTAYGNYHGRRTDSQNSQIVLCGDGLGAVM